MGVQNGVFTVSYAIIAKQLPQIGTLAGYEKWIETLNSY